MIASSQWPIGWQFLRPNMQQQQDHEKMSRGALSRATITFGMEQCSMLEVSECMILQPFVDLHALLLELEML